MPQNFLVIINFALETFLRSIIPCKLTKGSILSRDYPKLILTIKLANIPCVMSLNHPPYRHYAVSSSFLLTLSLPTWEDSRIWSQNQIRASKKEHHHYHHKIFTTKLLYNSIFLLIRSFFKKKNFNKNHIRLGYQRTHNNSILRCSRPNWLWSSFKQSCRLAHQKSQMCHW